MQKNNSDSPKKLTVTVDESISDIPIYDMFLIRDVDDCMEVQLASMSETDTEINVHVNDIFRIAKKDVPHFSRQFTKYVQSVISKDKSQDQSGD